MLNKPLLATAYLAPIGYYAILLQNTDCKIEHHEHFVKQSVRNRCEIYSANGKLRLTIPKQAQGSSKTLITNIKIAYKERWQQEHWNAIVSAYNSSPFFEYYKDELKPFFEEKEVYLTNFNNGLQEKILKFLKVNAKQIPSTEYKHTGDFTDLRNHKFISKKMEKYDQVFMEKHGFIANLSILDLLFNLGPESGAYLANMDTSFDI
ncbi:MAG: WbqC family protein [Bacteroidetes bacterium]|nr:WbqC family protein [Bacteroidota bacterium]